VTVCRFQAANRIRAQRRDREHTADAADDSIPSTVNVEQQVIDADLAERILREVAGLSALDRDIFRLCATEGYAYQAAAEAARRRTRGRPQSSLPHPHATADRCQGEHMNTDQQPDAGASREPLPELSDERINRIETSLFTEIARDRTVHRKRRTGVWVASSAAAAVIVVAAVIAPSVGGLLTGTASNDAAVGPAAPLVDSGSGGESDSSGGVAPDPNAVKEGLITSDDTGGADSDSGADVSEATRDIITTASATIVVRDISAAAAMITDAAVSRGRLRRVDEHRPVRPGRAGRSGDGHGLRQHDAVPLPSGRRLDHRARSADGLQSLVDQLSGLGEVTASSVNRQDVTAVTLDLEARVDAAQASVDRLTELMAAGRQPHRPHRGRIRPGRAPGDARVLPAAA
jgi:hypothetical protein